MTRVLVVDDKVDIRYYLESLLTGNGYTVQTAGNGAEALIRARAGPPDVVISDLLMPVMDGYTFLRHWKADPRLRAVPFIVYTATYTDPADESLALSMGADAFMLKPTEPEDFLVRLRAVEANAAAATPDPLKTATEEDGANFQVYNTALVRKLEEKTLQLEEANRALRQDLEKRERAEQALEEIRQRLALATESARIGIWDLDVRTNKLVWDDRMFALYGIEEGRFSGAYDAWQRGLHPEDRTRAEAELRTALEGGKSFETEFRVVWPSGEERVVEAHAVVVRLANGAPSHMVGVNWDITERRRAAEAIEEREVQFRTLAEAVPQIVWITRADGWNVYFNQQWTHYTGLSLEESVGEGWLKPFHPEDKPLALAAWRQATTAHGQYALESRLRRADGTYRWWLIRGLPLTDSAGNVLQWFGTCTDIHDLKLAQLAIAQSEKRFARVFQAGLIGFAIAETASGRIVDVNDRCAAIFGYGRDEMIGRTTFDLGLWADPADRQSVGAELAAGRPITGREAAFRRKTGEVCHALLSLEGMTLADAEEPLTLVALMDVTERKQLESQLLQAQKMEAVGRLAGGIAHDFNNLLGVILGYSEMLMRQVTGPQRDKLEQILKASQRAANLTRQLLAFSRKQVVDPKVLDVNSHLADLEKMVARLIGEDVVLTISPGAGLGRVKIDPGQLEQVVMNLCVNARDAMPEGGVLRIETSNTEMDTVHAARHDAMAPGRYVMLAVSDSGSGIDKETLAHVFEPFFTTKETGKGTGLGLSTVYGIVNQAGGSVSVYSEVGLGTTFRIYLPRCEEKATGATPELPLAPPRGSQTILLVEDEAALRSITRDLLEEHGYKILEAAGPADAIEIARAHPGPIHLLLTDVVMPGMNGRALAEAVLPVRPALPVLYMSGYTDDVLAHRGVLETGNSLLQKPFTTLALLARVGHALAPRSAELPPG